MTSMTTSQQNTFLSEIVSGEIIPPEKLGYFRGRLSNRFHELVLDLFVELERAGKITRAALARRIGKAPEQVTRWLGAPGNWTLDTVSDLFLGMGYEPALDTSDLAEQTAMVTSDVTFDELPAENNSLIADPVIYLHMFGDAQTNWYPNIFQRAAVPVQTASISNALLLQNNIQWRLPRVGALTTNYDLFSQYVAPNSPPPVEQHEEFYEWPPFEMVGFEGFSAAKAYLNRRKLQDSLQ
jgi:hypothetical protein